VPIRVLYLDHATELAGAEVSLLGLLSRLRRERVQPTLACPPGQLARRVAELGVEVDEFQPGKLRDGVRTLRSLGRLRAGRAALRRIIGSQPFDIVHANTLRTAAYAAATVRGRRPLLVWHVRDWHVPAWARRWLLGRCDAAIAPSRFIAESLGNSAKVRLVRNGIDPAVTPGPEAGAAFRRELGIPLDAPLAGCLGRLLEWKGQHHFVEAAAQVAARLPTARFLIVGSALYGDERRDYPALLKRKAAELDIAERLLFTGHRDDPLAALTAMDVVVNCSANEPFGRVVIEAMACRRPVVAFSSGAIPEIVEDGVSGRLVPLGDVRAMAQAICELLVAPEQARALGEAGRRRVESEFGLAASARATEAVYEELISASAARGRS